jgi:uncharacterized membrane protein
MSQAMKSRLSNYGFWVSLIALIPVVLQLFGVVIIPVSYTAVTNGILALFVALGIISNPTTISKFFFDDKEKK